MPVNRDIIKKKECPFVGFFFADPFEKPRWPTRERMDQSITGSKYSSASRRQRYIKALYLSYWHCSACCFSLGNCCLVSPWTGDTVLLTLMFDGI